MNQITLTFDSEVIIPDDDTALAVSALVESVPRVNLDHLLTLLVRHLII